MISRPKQLKAILMAVGLSLFALPANAVLHIPGISATTPVPPINSSELDRPLIPQVFLNSSQYSAVAEFQGTIPGNLEQGTTDGFGSAVKLNGDWAFVSAPIARPFGDVVGGAVYVYQKKHGQYGTTATQVIALPGVSHHLGLLKVESQGDWLFLSCFGTPVQDVGAPIGDFKGALLVYKLNCANNQWELFQQIDGTKVPELTHLVPTSVDALNPTNPPYNFQQGASFGLSFGVDVDKGVLLVGAQYQTTDANILNVGSVYAFQFQGNKWKFKQTLTNPEGIAANDTFGAQVAVKGKYALVSNGSIFQGPRKANSSVYVYEFKGNKWQYRQKLVSQQTNTTPVTFVLFGPGVLNIGDTFGSALAISDNWAIIGSAFENLGTSSVKGAAYFYKIKDGSSTPLKFKQKVVSVDPNPLAQNFALTGVAIDGKTAVVSNVCATGPTGIAFQGGANVYRRNDNGIWVLDTVLTDPQGADSRLFGAGVDVQGKKIIVGGGFNGINIQIVGTPPLVFLPPPNNLPPLPPLRNAVIFERQ